MCVILVLKPGVMPHKDALWNAVYNNWHSYGLITKAPGKFDVLKVCPEEEVDPQEVWDVLQERKGLLRYLHLRHNTAGATSDENTHPFEVYRSKKEEVWFMHNGTLYEYKSKKQTPSKHQPGSFVTEDDPDGPSDTKNFADRVLIPFVGSIINKRGQVADLQNPLLQRVIQKHWPTTGNNRGILIAKNQDSFVFGDWKTLKGENGDEFLSSNDDYYEKVSRGPEHVRRSLREEEEKRQQYVAKEVQKAARTSVPVTQMSTLDLQGGLGKYSLAESAKNILGDYTVWDRETASAALWKLTKNELFELHSDRDTTVHLMDWIFSDYCQVFDELEEETRRRKKAEQHIIDLKRELQETRVG